MANVFSTGWLLAFTQMRRPTKFLQGFFTKKPGGTYNGKTVEIDIQRFGEDVAVALRSGRGANLNDADVVTTKEFEPPKYGEAFPANVEDLVTRMAGTDPYSAAGIDYGRQLVFKLMRYFMLGMDKIVRGVELQASQILQTGKLVLTDADGTVYQLDFKPKATHFPTVSTKWDAAGAAPLTDLAAVGDLIRADGQVNPDILIMGSKALASFLANDGVQKQLDNKRYEIGSIAPQWMVNSGATFYGMVWIGAYQYQIWTYGEGYKAANGTWTPYIDPKNVVMLSSNTRFDLVSAMVPLPLGPDPRVADMMPGRLVDDSQGLDVTPNLWCTPNGKQLMAEIEARPLLVPVQIDGFGCLTVLA